MFGKKGIYYIITIFIVLFSFNINVKAEAVEGSCAHCGEKACIQINQDKNGKVTFKFREKSATTWKPVKNGDNVKIGKDDYPINIDSSITKNLNGCPSPLELGKSCLTCKKEFKVYPVITCASTNGLNPACSSSPIENSFPNSVTNKPSNSNGATKSGSTTSGLTKKSGGSEGKPSCKEALGTELIAKIQEIIDIIWILVPVLLIVFGMMDFGKAIFLNDENEMKKAQSTFFKRVIIAIAFFMVPVILQLFLTIAHGVWDVVPSDLCGIEFGLK
ncbi:MAG: hypothetical protein VZS44_00235 [Bacilli bacterium]|nr:hypothetical protein [Bacilli bacterium]